MIKNRLVHFETQAQYLAKKDEIDFGAIVFVDEGRKIYTHGEEYDGNSINITEIYNKFENLEALYNQIIGNIGSSDIETTNPTVGQILMYNAALEKWVNVSPKTLKNSFVTVGTSADNDDQTIYGKKTFVDDTYFKKLTGGPVISTEIINSTYGYLENGGDYILCADGSVRYIYDILKANPGISDSQHRVVVSDEGQSRYISWKATGIDSQFVNDLRIYSVVDGGYLSLEFSALEGYTVDHITVNNRYIGNPGTVYTISGITEDTVIQIFARSTSPQLATTHNLAINAQHASWKVSGVDSDFVTTPVYSITEGNPVTITFKADDGYRIDYINPSGSTANVGTNYVTFPGLFENSNITISTSSLTETPKRIVKVRCGSNGNVDGSAYKEYEVNDGGTISIQFNPHDGYEIDRIWVNDVLLDTVTNPLILTEINKTTEVYVLFKPMESTPVTKYVGVTCGRNGYAVFNGHVISANTFVSFSVTSGDSATVTAVPNSGYEIDSITVTDVNNNVIDTTSEDIIEISNIRQNLNVRVTFKEASSTPIDDGKRTVTINGGQHVSYWVDNYDADGQWQTGTNQYQNIQSGSQIDVYIVADKDYEISNVKVGNTTISPIDASQGLYRITVIADSTIQITAVEESTTPENPDTPTGDVKKIEMTCGRADFRVVGQGVSSEDNDWINATDGWIINNLNSVHSGIEYDVPATGSVVIEMRPNSGWSVSEINIHEQGDYTTHTTIPASNLSDNNGVYSYTLNVSELTGEYYYVTIITTYGNTNRPARLAPSSKVLAAYYGFAESTINDIEDIQEGVAATVQEFKSGEYTSTATSTNNYWYIAVPKAWGVPTVQYKRGLGALSIETVNGISDSQYNVYRVTTPHRAGEYTFTIQ